MTYDALGPGALDYLPCRYGGSKLLFRGPRRSLKAPYVAFIGGAETYGKFLKSPFPALVETDIGMNCVNFGIPNAGVDAFANDGCILQAASDARVTVIQAMGAQNISNRFYSVHPRRNDRFVAASDLLSTIFRDVDFAEFHYNKHMLSSLYHTSAERFATVRAELQSAWVARMQQMTRQIRGKTVLMWFADHAPLANERVGLDPAKCPDPLFITREMIDEIAPSVTEVVEVVPSRGAIAKGSDGMVFGALEAVVASKMMGPKAHLEAAASLGSVLSRLM